MGQVGLFVAATSRSVMTPSGAMELQQHQPSSAVSAIATPLLLGSPTIRRNMLEFFDCGNEVTRSWLLSRRL